LSRQKVKKIPYFTYECGLVNWKAGNTVHGKKLIPVWKEVNTGVERSLCQGGKKLMPWRKETYTSVERNLYLGGEESHMSTQISLLNNNYLNIKI